MKKVLTALVLFVTAFALFGLKTQAAGTGNLVIHFKAWDKAFDYSTLGSWGWNGIAGKVKDGTDDFGAYWTYNDIAIPDVANEIGFIAVQWPGGAGPDWNAKLTGDVMISSNVLKDGKTVHVYVFQGAAGAQYFAADPDKYNVLALYYDPANAYSEDLGIHGWGWVGDAGSSSWGTPTKVFQNAGVAQSGYPVKGFIVAAVETWAGFLVYAGDDASKKTGDLKPDTGWFTEQAAGKVEVVYIVNAGDAVTDNSNVYTDYAEFADEAFSFKLKPFVADGMTGTFAQNPTDIYVETSAPITSPYPTAVDKDAAKAEIKSWFTVKEKINETTYGPALTIERVDFALSATTLNTFVIVLAQNSKLDNTKEYEVFFDLGHPVDVEKQVEVTLELTVPANTPVDAVLKVAGSFNGWNPEAEGYAATKVGDIYTVTFMVDIDKAYTTMEYKWTRGSWPTAEFVEGNRSFTIVSDQDEVVFEDVVEAWEDINPPASKYAAPDRAVEQLSPNISASIELVMDTAKPELTFISPSGIVGKPAAERIIEVEWGKPFDQNLFPGYRVVDDRDGDLTPLVFVPKGEFSKVDTSKVGDYTIMLQVEDKWGNITQETFIFRVVKK